MHTNHRNKIQSKCAVWSTKFVETFICDNVCINNLYVKHFYSCACLYKLLYSITDFIVFFLNAPLIKLIITKPSVTLQQRRAHTLVLPGASLTWSGLRLHTHTWCPFPNYRYTSERFWLHLSFFAWMRSLTKPRSIINLMELNTAQRKGI